MFVGDMFKQINTAIYMEGNLVERRNVIIKNYFKNRFFFDLVSTLSLAGVLKIKLLFFIRFYITENIVEKIREHLALNDFRNGIAKLIIMIQKIVFLCHIVACIWHYIGVT